MATESPKPDRDHQSSNVSTDGKGAPWDRRASSEEFVVFSDTTDNVCGAYVHRNWDFIKVDRERFALIGQQKRNFRRICAMHRTADVKCERSVAEHCHCQPAYGTIKTCMCRSANANGWNTFLTTGENDGRKSTEFCHGDKYRKFIGVTWTIQSRGLWPSAYANNAITWIFWRN